VVYEYFAEEKNCPPISEGVEEADVIDSFSYSSIEIGERRLPEERSIQP